jgi:hypothetical protein
MRFAPLTQHWWERFAPLLSLMSPVWNTFAGSRPLFASLMILS